jgi:predicted PurR-regulated permease PerM
MNRSLDWVILRYLGYASVFLGAFVLLYLVRGTLPVFLIALMLAYAFEPLLQMLERRGYSRQGAVGLVFLVFLLVCVCLVALLASAWQQAQALASNFPKYTHQAETLTANLQARLDDLHLPKDVKTSIAEAVAQMRHNAPAIISERLKDAIAYIFGSIGYIGVMAVVLPIITFWLMLEMNPIRARTMMLVPPLYRRDVAEMAIEINKILGRYVRGQLIICSLFGLLCTIAFEILAQVYHMGYPSVLGICAAFLYVVPYVGLGILMIAVGATAYFTATVPVACVLFALGSCIAFNLILDYLVSPRVVGQGVGLHPLMVIFALLSGAEVGGIPGMILAVPFFASLRAVLVYLFPQLTAPIPHTPAELETPVALLTEIGAEEVPDDSKEAAADPAGGAESGTGPAVLRETAEAEASAAAPR